MMCKETKAREWETKLKDIFVELYCIEAMSSLLKCLLFLVKLIAYEVYLLQQQKLNLVEP